MENTLLNGDRIIVNKLYYGPRLPRSGFEIPWLNLFWYLNPKAKENLGEAKWSYYRLSGSSQIKCGDIVVFNNPEKTSKLLIKRCVALSGDSLQIVNNNLYVNGQNKIFSENIKLEFKVYYHNRKHIAKQLDSLKETSKSEFDQLEYNFFNGLLFSEYNVNSRQNKQIPYLICNMSNKQKNSIVDLLSVDSVRLHINNPQHFSDIFPEDSSFKWSKSDFGLVVIPKKEMEIVLNNKNYALYYSIIQDFERTNILKTDSGFYEGNKPIKTYRFKQDYYFMLGDNRHQALDSRYLGFIPESHIVGKAVMVLFSYSNKIRWERMFK